MNVASSATTLKCLKHCQARIEDVAATIRLRGGPTVTIPTSASSRNKKITSERQDIETLSEQQAWLRRNIAELPQKFDDKEFVSSVTQKMQSTLKRIEDILESLLENNTFKDPLMSDKLQAVSKHAQKLITSVLGKRFAKSSVAPIDHLAADGKSYSTILVSFKNVKKDDGIVLPWLVFAFSETQERNADSRRRYMTAMSSPNTTFTPRFEFKDLKQMERLVQMFLTEKNISTSNKPVIEIPDDVSLKGVVKAAVTSNVKGGKLTITIERDKGHKIDQVALEGMKALVSILRQKIPGFNGNIQYTSKPETKTEKAQITFSSTLTAKDKTTNNVKRPSFRLDESKLADISDTSSKINNIYSDGTGASGGGNEGNGNTLLLIDNAGLFLIDNAGMISIKDFFAQLGVGSMAMIGAKDIVYSKKDGYFRFRIGKNAKGVTIVKVALRNDLYDLDFMKLKKLEIVTVSSARDIGAENLSKVFTEHTGLLTRFK